MLSQASLLGDICGISEEVPDVLDVPILRARSRALLADVCERRVHSFLPRSWRGIGGDLQGGSELRANALHVRLLIEILRREDVLLSLLDELHHILSPLVWRHVYCSEALWPTAPWRLSIGRAAKRAWLLRKHLRWAFPRAGPLDLLGRLDRLLADESFLRGRLLPNEASRWLGKISRLLSLD